VRSAEGGELQKRHPEGARLCRSVEEYTTPRGKKGSAVGGAGVHRATRTVRRRGVERVPRDVKGGRSPVSGPDGNSQGQGN